MPQTRQHIPEKRPVRRHRLSGGVALTQDEIQKFLAAYETLTRQEGTVQFYHRKLQRLYQELPEVTTEAIRERKIICGQNKQKRIVTVPARLRKELLDYAQKNGILSGPIFQTRDGRPMHRTYVTTTIRKLCEDARIPESKGNPKSSQKLYLSTQSRIKSNVSLLVDQAMEHIMEQEQFSVGWEENL